MSTQEMRPITSLAGLAELVQQLDGFDGIVAELQAGRSVTIDGAWGSSCALAASALSKRDLKLICVLPRVADVDDFVGDISSFCGRSPVIFPAWESLPDEYRVSDPIFGRRLHILEEVEAGAMPDVIVTSLPALMQPVPERKQRENATRSLRVGDELDPHELMTWLGSRGFVRVPAVEQPGEFAIRGGILDVWPADTVDPLRFEFFGDEIDDIRRFDAETQRKVESLTEVKLTAVGSQSEGWTQQAEEKTGPAGPSFLESLPPQTVVAFLDIEKLTEEGHNYLARLDDPAGLFSVEQTFAKCTEFPSAAISALGADSAERTLRLQVESVERFTGGKDQVIREFAASIGSEEQVIIACHNPAEQGRLGELFGEIDREREQHALPAISPRLSLLVGHVHSGFRLVSHRVIVIGDHQLFGRHDVRRTSRKKRVDSRAIDNFLDLNEGDLIVHLTNGIGRFRGIKLLEKSGQQEEHLELEFADNIRMFVPVALIHLVQKYVGASKAAPRLSKLGGNTWAKKKEKVAQAVRDMASEMIRLQAAREATPGISHPPDSHYQQEFEDAFPYTATPDQADAIVEIKADMERSRPTDRLICGDVGYGKTEVAMRAAFKAVDAGKQVAVLVPTTVLAEQHGRTFGDRMAEFPVTIESLSRFRTGKEQRKIIEGLKSGGVDIVIGTHRLVSEDVKFKDLGLLVIDEEQRFGVDVKEALKHMRLEVDVITLSATPIPRTLHLSLLGIRDISNLVTPPVDRQAIETRISRWDDTLIRNAIVRELNRNGQIYFVHNRVYNIKTIAAHLERIVPEATVGIVHGQMNPDELETTMTEFVRGRLDILVATTIIESGLDIPNANTMFIHQADKYGLADLHQLRGRVGRHHHRAYCYLLLEEGRILTQTATKRLKAIEEFSELGAGFKIAMRDLEIRGAGNILGNEQSGHISSVGYELYCQLLENAVRSLKNEPPREPLLVNVDLPVSAFIPNSYIAAGRPKIEAYRLLSTVRTEAELESLREEFRDRYGPVPDSVERLFAVKELQVLARQWELDELRLEDDDAVLVYRSEAKVRALKKQWGRDFRIVDSKTAYYRLPDGNAQHEELLGMLKSLLRINL
ncbi:transcription-repair coupling factor [Calycomorphotria hydatis]|uniref:Transcription-repair-coupling factor n=1 Tax=Calycomorphotria hydatis TaxID=2528027 RepID=A0A517TB38_9PLAN|nr:transcription-repair coupling factor [Calycomorphotria hydatis]QDT65589.1 Transcription-repair-coupling factor [Calycomorphotria hydatis]